jgi:hypothetical protein
MKGQEQKDSALPLGTSPPMECRAEFIFYARNQSRKPGSVEVLGDYACDFRRPDWAHRWTDWNSGRNHYLNLFLCAKHARELGLL